MLVLKELLRNNDRKFYLLFVLTIITIFFTNPFLKYPYDVFVHLGRIDVLYGTEVWPKGRLVWHYSWAKIFHIFNVDGSYIFLRAYVIHFTQTTLSFISVFFLSKVIIRNLFINIENIYTNYLAYWSTIIWFTIFATFSMYHHQVWFLWYSVNYQVSLPLTLLITGFILALIFENLTVKRKIIYIIIILVLSHIILIIHSMEYLYFLMYIFVLFFIFSDKYLFLIKKRLYYSIPLSFVSIYLFIKLLFFLNSYERKKSRILEYISLEKISELIPKINADGQILLSGLNRAFASMNELIYLSIFFLILMMFIQLCQVYIKKTSTINMRLFVFLSVTSFFVLIPIIGFTAGLAGLITSSVAVVNRFYYSSLLFLIIPCAVFFFINLFGMKKIITINIIVMMILSGTFIYSKYFSETHNYYKNIISIKNSFIERKVGFNLSDDDIYHIGITLKTYEINKNQEDQFFYAREDIAFILKYIYKKNVYLPAHWNGRKFEVKKYITEFESDLKHKNKVLFEMPKGFPAYEPYR